jgi:hypothetical protein
VLGPEALAVIAHERALRLLSLVSHGGRWFARLEKVGAREWAT